MVVPASSAEEGERGGKFVKKSGHQHLARKS